MLSSYNPESLHLCISASLHLCIPASLHLCISASLHPCIPASLHLCISASLHLYISASLHLCISASLHLCISASLQLVSFQIAHLGACELVQWDPNILKHLNGHLGNLQFQRIKSSIQLVPVNYYSVFKQPTILIFHNFAQRA